MRKSKIKLIILDAYGPVITGGYPATCKFLAKKFKRDRREFYKVVYKQYFNQAAERKIGQKEAWEKAIKDLDLPLSVKEIKKIHYGLMGLNKQVLNFIKKFDNKVKILLLSKNTRSQFSDVNNRVGFRKYFKYVINTWELYLPKASAETIKVIMKRFKVKPSEIVYIDDQKENLTDAKQMGIKTIFYKSFKQFKKEVKKFIN